MFPAPRTEATTEPADVPTTRSLPPRSMPRWAISNR